MRLSRKTLRGGLASAFVASIVGGCIAFPYDFEKVPPTYCLSVTDCGAEETICGKPACLNGACTFTDIAAEGTLLPDVDQKKGDCQVKACDGKGSVALKADNLDVPPFDGDCTKVSCENGAVKSELVPAMTPCGAAPGLLCDGAGFCTGCTSDMQCGAETACFDWTCDITSTPTTCKRQRKAPGTLVSDMLGGDCMAQVCDKNGDVVTGPYVEDKPVDPGPCIIASCDEQGNQTTQNRPDDADCSSMGMCRHCVAGACVVDCPAGYKCNLPMTTCTPDVPQENGKACATGSDCKSGFCPPQDGVCCDTPCDGLCQSCLAVKNGLNTGQCGPVSNGNDFDNECGSPVGDVCFDGKCRCANGLKDDNEDLVDCGGGCNPCPNKWVCDGSFAQCIPNQQCCMNSTCGECTGDGTPDMCTSINNLPCEPGSAPKRLVYAGTPVVPCSSGKACFIVNCVCK